MKAIYELRNNIGKIPLCNKKPERAPHIFEWCFPLCWRCTMVTVFSFISTIVFSFIKPTIIGSNTFTILGSILVLPMIFDGGIQYFAKWGSTNFRRAIVGSLFGIGIVILSFQFVNIVKK